MIQDVTTPIEGTSCSSPGFASVIVLINDRLVAARKPTLGFLNPWLYGTVASGGALMDITVGHNSGDECGDPMFSGFDAAVGWDPLSECSACVLFFLFFLFVGSRLWDQG
jgi:tripeptidyl-peptidase-1